MCDPFQIDFVGNPNTVFNKLKDEVTAHNGEIDGDATAGTFSIQSIKGNYAIAGQQIEITITKSPFFISCKTIENGLRQRFNGL